MTNQTVDHKTLFGGHINMTLSTSAKLLREFPASAKAFARVAKAWKKSGKRREANAAKGVDVPPLLIVSTTEECNLTCAGCYSCARGEAQAPELSAQRAGELLDEASALGVSIVLLAGGEPLVRRDWLHALGQHPELLGIVFTNGTLFDGDTLDWFHKHRHIIPAISMEGTEKQTNDRRGAGVYAQVRAAMDALQSRKIPYGLSITMTSENINGVLDEAFIEGFTKRGCRLFVFVEYVPVEPGTRPLVLSKAEKGRLDAFSRAMGEKYPAIFLPFPGDEGQYGGCLAAGRGFAHISATGGMEPCPFAPFSDCNLADVNLETALRSPFLAYVRDNHHLLKEGEGGCALWSNREALEQMMAKIE